MIVVFLYNMITDESMSIIVNKIKEITNNRYNIVIENNKKIIYDRFISLFNNKNINPDLFIYSIDSLVKMYLLDKYFNNVKITQLNNMIMMISNLYKTLKDNTKNKTNGLITNDQRIKSHIDILYCCLLSLILSRKKYIDYIETEIYNYISNATNYLIDPTDENSIELLIEFTDICSTKMYIRHFMSYIIDILDILNKYDYKQQQTLNTIVDILFRLVKSNKPYQFNECKNDNQNNFNDSDNKYKLFNEATDLLHITTSLMNDIITNKIMRKLQKKPITDVTFSYIDISKYKYIIDDFYKNDICPFDMSYINLTDYYVNQFYLYYESYNSMLKLQDVNLLPTINLFENSINNLIIKMKINNIFSNINRQTKYDIAQKIISAANTKINLLRLI